MDKKVLLIIGLVTVITRSNAGLVDYQDYLGDFPSFFYNFQEAFINQIFMLRRGHLQSIMKNGIGGVTLLVTKDKVLFKKGGAKFVCDGQIIPDKPFCNGTLRKFKIKKDHDYCYSESYMLLNENLCIGETEISYVQPDPYNGQYDCLGADGKKLFMIPLADYIKMCNKVPGQDIYWYYPDVTNNFHLELPDPSLGCAQDREDVCVFQ